MRFLVWSCIFTSLSLLQDSIDSSDLLDINFGIKILIRYHIDLKSLCVLSNESIISDKRYLNKVIIEIAGKNVGYNIVAFEEDINQLILNYFKFRQNTEKYMKILAEYLTPDKCHLTSTVKNHVSKLIINNLQSKLNSLGIDTCAELLVLACECEIYYKELVIYSGYVNRREQKLSDILTFNDAIRKFAQGSFDKTPISLLLDRIHDFMYTVLGSVHQTSIHVILCLLSKSIYSYDNNELEWIPDSYITIINALNNNETCMLRTLNIKRQMYLFTILENVKGVKLNEIERIGILYGLENLFAIMDDTSIYLLLNIHREKKYFNDNCNYKLDQFLIDYNSNVAGILKNSTDNFVIRNKGEMIIFYCIYASIKNEDKIEDDKGMLSVLDIILNAYDIFTSIFLPFEYFYNYDSVHKMMTNYLITNPELHLRNSYLNKLIFNCKLLSYHKKQINNDYLKKIYAYLYKYVFKYCPHHSSDVKSFSDDISKNVLGFENNDFITLNYIKYLVDKFLDQSNNNITVTWLEAFEFEVGSCHIKENINYSLIYFEQKSKIKYIFSEFNGTIIPLCSLIKSTAKVASDFNKPVSKRDWITVFELGINFIKSELYKNLKYNEQLNILRKSVYDSLKTYRLSQGILMRLECEIKIIIEKGLPDLSSNMLKNIYMHLAVKYSNRICLLDKSMFRVNQITKLVYHLKLYPGLTELDDDKVYAYILYLKKNIPKVVSKLRSNDNLAEVIPEIINKVGCNFNKTTLELDKIFTEFIKKKYRQETLYMNFLRFYRCLLFYETRLYSSNLYQNESLSPIEIEDLNKLYRNTISLNPELREINDHNFNAILDKIKIRVEYKQFISHPLKLSMTECHIRKLHNNVYFNESEIKTSKYLTTLTTLGYISTTKSTDYPGISQSSVIGIVICCTAAMSIIACGIAYYFKRRKSYKIWRIYF